MYVGCSCLLASVVFARGGPKLDLGSLSDGKDMLITLCYKPTV